MLSDGDLDSTPQPSPEDGPMAAEEEELPEEPSMDFASSIEKVKDVSSYILVAYCHQLCLICLYFAEVLLLLQ
jgi:hypothetical protein